MLILLNCATYLFYDQTFAIGNQQYLQHLVVIGHQLHHNTQKEKRKYTLFILTYYLIQVELVILPRSVVNETPPEQQNQQPPPPPPPQNQDSGEEQNEEEDPEVIEMDQYLR